MVILVRRRPPAPTPPPGPPPAPPPSPKPPAAPPKPSAPRPPPPVRDQESRHRRRAFSVGETTEMIAIHPPNPTPAAFHSLTFPQHPPSPPPSPRPPSPPPSPPPPLVRSPTILRCQRRATVARACLTPSGFAPAADMQSRFVRLHRFSRSLRSPASCPSTSTRLRQCPPLPSPRSSGRPSRQASLR